MEMTMETITEMTTLVTRTEARMVRLLQSHLPYSSIVAIRNVMKSNFVNLKEAETREIIMVETTETPIPEIIMELITVRYWYFLDSSHCKGTIFKYHHDPYII